MIRRWHVEPNVQVETADGPVWAVSRQEGLEAVIDAYVMADRAGGGFSVWYDRYPTGLPGEMVTTGLVIQWQDRTDAKAAPERQQGQPQRPQEDPHVAFEHVQAGPPEVDPRDDPTQYVGGEYVDDIGDGIDPAALPEEDDSSVEERV